MKLTNKNNIPEIFSKFDTEFAHDKGEADISVTTLIDSPRITKLKCVHADEIVEDISSRALAILGTAVHEILRVENLHSSDSIAEERLSATINGMKISGQIDLITATQGGYLLSDYKTVRGGAIASNPDGKIEWEKQLNCYAALARLNMDFIDQSYGRSSRSGSSPPLTVNALEVVAIVRDWTAAQAERNPNFPQASIVRIPVKLWSGWDAYTYISERVDHHRSEDVLCADEERWMSPPTFAVYEYTQSRTLRKRATRLLHSRTEAETFALGLKGSYKIKERPPVYRRCEGNYCGVADFCQQHRSNQ